MVVKVCSVLEYLSADFGGFLGLTMFCFDSDCIKRGSEACLAPLCGREDRSALKTLHADPVMETTLLAPKQKALFLRKTVFI